MKNIFNASLLTFAMGALLMLGGCSGNKPAEQAEDPAAPADGSPMPSNATGFDQLAPPAEGEEYAVITTDFGVIELRLFPELAPNAVQNFVQHAKDGYYDGLIFHRVAKDFVIQTGDPLGTGYGGESIFGEGFMIEPSVELRHFSGALAMARGEDPGSQGSQFYITQNVPLGDMLVPEFEYMRDHQDEEVQEGSGVTIGQLFPAWAVDKYLGVGGAPALDLKYTVFGQAFSGIDVVEQIGAVEVVEGGEKPVTDVKMISVEIKEYKK